MSLTGKKIDYNGATELPSLEVPPNLTTPTTDQRFAIPGAAGTPGQTTYSTYAQTHQIAQTQTSAGTSGILPVQPKVTLERAGSERWLVVNEPPAKVWPVVKAFWHSVGFTVVEEHPAAGIMVTNWAENRANIPQGVIRNFLGKFLDQVYSTPQRDKFRTRLERGRVPGTTEVYISHQGMYEVVEHGDDGGPSVWEPMPPDPGLEAEMLARLMARFGVAKAQANAMLAAPAAQVRAHIVQGADGAATLTVDDGFDRAWDRVGLALDRVGFTVVDQDRSKGVYYVRYVDPTAGTQKRGGFFSKLAFWRSEKKPPQTRYQVRVTQSGTGSLVEVLGHDGGVADPKTATRIVDLLYEQLK
ncbi:MAG: outer membrane protein assembly factor BamC [Betaproteobacteria bacterium]|nr:outer membrane protein assembly factor BamC [Betaproteobacteria bacterium]